MSAEVKTVGVTAFKGRCLGLIDDVAEGRTERIVLTRRGQPVAEVVPIRDPARKPSLYGCMKGEIWIAPGVDLTEPLDDAWADWKGWKNDQAS